MSETAPGAGAPGDAATVAALRRVKAVEAEWDAKLHAARDEAARALQRARDEREATEKAVAAELAAERNRRLDEARRTADREAEAIRADGEKAAGALRQEKSGAAKQRADEIVAAVLGPLAKE